MAFSSFLPCLQSFSWITTVKIQQVGANSLCVCISEGPIPSRQPALGPCLLFRILAPVFIPGSAPGHGVFSSSYALPGTSILASLLFLEVSGYFFPCKLRRVQERKVMILLIIRLFFVVRLGAILYLYGS